MFIYVRNNNIIGSGAYKLLDEDIINIESAVNPEELDKYIYKDGNIILDPDYEEKQKQAERERINMLSMTRGDVFEALILAKGLGKAQIRAMIEQVELDEITKALYLNRFDEALEFYRGYPIFDLLGATLGITSDMLDKFFDTKDYKYLTTCTLTIKPTPTDAIVTGDGAYPYGSEVEYKVEADGYITKTGTVALMEDTTLEVVLDEDTTNAPGQDSLEGEAN